MIQKQVTVTSTPTSVYTLLETPQKAYCNSIALQALDTNATKIYFGPSGAQVGFLVAGASVLLPVKSLDKVFLKGSEDVVITVL